VLAKCLYPEAVKIGVQITLTAYFAVISMLFPHAKAVRIITAATVPN